jgi:hypothetical protein
MAIFLGFFGYLVPIPSLIWGWVLWSRSKPRIGAPLWKYIATVSGLILCSWIVVVNLFMLAWAWGHVLENHPYSWLSNTTYVRGLIAATLALILSFVGKGAARVPACLSSSALGTFFFLGSLPR